VWVCANWVRYTSKFACVLTLTDVELAHNLYYIVIYWCITWWPVSRNSW